MFESLKARIGVGGRHRQYVNIESVRDLEDVSDPEETTDESQTTAREWASNHPGYASVVAVAGFLVLGVVLFWMTRIVPGIITNPLVWKGGIVLISAAFIYRKGWKAHRERVSGWDELELVVNGDPVSYKGIYLDDFPGDADGFIPIKGWRRGGHHAVPYKNGELGAALVESFDRARMDDDNAAVIRLKPTETGVTHTDWGTRVVQRTGGLEPDVQGDHTTLEATLPNYDDNRANELAEQLEQVTKDYYDAMDEVQSLQRRVVNIKDRLNEPLDEMFDKQIDQHRQLAEAMHGRRRDRQSDDRLGPRPQQDFKGNGSMQNGHDESDLEDVENEVSPDDD